MGHIHHNPAVFQRTNHLAAKRRKPIGGVVTTCDAVLAVPREGYHLDPVSLPFVNNAEVRAYWRGVLNREHRCRLSGGEHLVNRACVTYLHDALAVLCHLRKEIRAGTAIELEWCQLLQLIGYPDGVALAPRPNALHALKRQSELVVHEVSLGARKADKRPGVAEGKRVDGVAVQVKNRDVRHG